MTRNQLHAGLALGSVFLMAGIVAFAPPVPPASAQSQAERICREQGIKKTSEGYEYCLSQAIRAIEWGKPEIAHTMARVTADARDACLEYGLTPATSGYKSCMERETHARRLLVFTDDPHTTGRSPSSNSVARPHHGRAFLSSDERRMS